MNLSSNLLLIPGFWYSAILYVLLFIWALNRIDYNRLLNGQDSQILFAACVGLWLMWRLQAEIPNYPYLEFHFLMVTSIVLMFGPAFAIFCVSIAQLLLSIEGIADWDSYFINVLVNGIFPIFITYGLYFLITRFLPWHFFVYIYVCTFLGAAISIFASRLLGMGLLMLNDIYSFAQIHDYFIYSIAIMFPEAFLNGAIMTLLVVFRPEWVSSFQDKNYL